ncbi:MSF1-domain-containing protein [Choiromyces venosus 120613-1]|uniref:MSF1-domain-containing protein n=1 Tax=Choiromyces venosus 120613-1 TaxID=1336337 RepID=A0A3N4K245_9PEZI|nr:MSF1-domain-containing protein [Choiromyces venosus 120613-1]
MVKFYENSFSYDYQWPAVTLAYFLRYPNPYSKHVVSSDTLSSHLDPRTGNLHVTRLHLKRGKLPASVARFLPKIKESYILEKSIVDVKNQRLETETRNLDWEGVLSVVESQVYTSGSDSSIPSEPEAVAAAGTGKTDVTTIVRFESRLGGGAARNTQSDGEEVKSGWFSSWTTGSVQRSIELVGVRRMREGFVRRREGMKVVLEQLRERGFVGVIKEQRQGGWERWKKVWRGEGVERMDD